MSRTFHRAQAAALLALAGFLGGAISGCVEGRPPINQVQPGALSKTVFEESEWFYQQTVIDSPYSAGYTFVGEQGDLERVVWEIQEEFLVARRGYQFIDNSEPNGISGEATETGAPIAAYRIQSHFDIRRAYNPLTGEEMNVVTENTTDRPWYQRDYIRVDWSQNIITDNSFLVLARIFDGIQTEPMAYSVENPTHPHAPRFETRAEDGTWSGVTFDSPITAERDVHYMDIVNKMFVRPTTVDIPGLGPVPSCYLLYQGHLDCAPGEVTVRHSFLRVDAEDRDYQPMLYTGDRMERFGYFVSERAGYDEHYGVVEPARFRFANRHNLWMQSHKRDGEGNLLRCNDDSACGGGGSVCDLDYARAHRALDDDRRLLGACTIPYRERDTRPIAYHVTANFPESLWPDAHHLVEEWNSGFADVVGSLREVECLEHGGDAGSCAAERMRADSQDMFVLCHNPVQADDHEACGAEGVSAQAGDLRRSIIGWVNDPHLSSPLGYGPSSADPLTGEIIMGNAFIYGAAMETLTTFARDIIAVLNGDLTESEISSGAQVQAWIDSMEAPTSLETGRSRDDHAVHVDGLDAESINAAMDFSWARSPRSAARTPSSPAELLEAMEAAENRLWRDGALGNGTDTAEARLHSLIGTDIERMMTTADVRLAAGIDPHLPVGEEALNRASPLRGGSLANARALARARDRMQHDHCILGAEFADDSLIGLARAIVAEANGGDGVMNWYGVDYQIVNGAGELDYTLVREMLRHPIFDAVTAHEVGHTIGLRHNFSGSYDALNYRPEYWDLRDDGDMQPRAWDPMSEAEIEGRIVEYQYSTVMDYGVNFVVTDSVGIGHYDRAAIKMGYGDLVEVFTNAADPGTIAWMSFIQSAGWPVPLKLSAFTGGEPAAYMYTDWPDVVGAGNVARLQERADVRYTSLRPDSFLAFQGIHDPIVDQMGRPAVPYLFCSDEQADLNPDCQRYDQGADAYESLQSVMDTYWSYYIFNNFRRQRLGYSPEATAGRIHSRYFEKLQRANQIYALYRAVFTDIFGDNAGFEAFWTRPDGMGAWTVAVGASFELLTRVVTTPEPGQYTATLRPSGESALVPAAFGERVDLTVSPFDGRAIETSWNFDAGYFWFDQLERTGYFYDKSIALQILVDPTTYFLGRDTDADIRQFQINFGRSFGPSLTGFMEGLLAENWDRVAPRAGGGGLVYPTPGELTTGTMPGVPVDPNASFSIQLYAAVYGMTYIPQTYDQTFLNRSRIFVRGAAEAVDLAPGTPTVEFTDTASGLTYVAVRYLDGAGNETGVGASMLEHALALQAAGSAVELRSFIDNIDVVRRLSARLGAGAQP